ncbi:MAG: AEC family transporter [Clostridia bacterium]|nr:AEC family transporter [Clostridia bacterium]
MTTFLATLTPMLTLFFCIAIGFLSAKTKILPESASQTMAKMETWILCPALSFMTMLRYFTVDSLLTHGTNIMMATISMALAMAIAIPLAKLFVKENNAERGVYSYALAFANFGYIGDPIVLALFGEEVLAYYKLFCLPLTIVIYTWGISVLTPQREGNGGRGEMFKRLLNAPTVAMLIGAVMGLSGLGVYLPEFLISALDSIKACMGPVAMLLAGVTIARFDFIGMLKKKKVYVATLLRLAVIPTVIIAALFGIKTLANLLFGFSIGNDVLFLCFFATATPLGLNTVVFPEAYGGNPETGASMAMISHTLCVVSIPIMYALMVAVFGVPFGV